MNTNDFKSFHYLENGEIVFSEFETIKSSKKLESGSYKLSFIGYPKNTPILKIDNDKESVKIHSFPDKPKLDNLFNSFFEDKVHSKITELGFYHKVGILLYGKEGTGKSTIIKYYCNLAIENKNALVFHFKALREGVKECWELIMNIRKVQNNPIIIVFEEFDDHIEFRNESYLKTCLDGNMSMNNCICMATTNYIDRIPDAMKFRPSRFKYTINIEGIQEEKEVYDIIHKMLSDTFDKDDIKSFTYELIGKTLDEIKQFCIDKIMELQSYNPKKKSTIGFFAHN